MPVAVDASTPARWSGTPADNVDITSPSFTAPADALLEVTVSHETDDVDITLAVVVSDSGGLSWTTRVEEQRGSDGGTFWIGYTGIFTARTTSAVSRTIGVKRTNGAGGTRRISAKCYVKTGVDVNGTPVDSVTTSNEGSSATNNLTTTSITPGASGMLMAAITDSNALGVYAASDLTMDTAHYAVEISVASGYKTTTSGVGVTANFDANGGGAAYQKWCQIIARELALPGASARRPKSRPFPFAPGASRFRGQF